MPLVSVPGNPHQGINLLAGISFFVTYIRMMDDDIHDENLVLDEPEEEDEELEEDERY